jgi:ribosome-associated heat shock protein Hsp15
MEPTQRLDKWLWCARFFRTRAMAAALCEAGRVRVSGQVVHKAHYTLKPGDVLTFPQGGLVRVVRVAGFAERRGPASAAVALYEDLAPPERSPSASPADLG